MVRWPPIAATVRCMVESRGSFRFSRRDICIWPIPRTSAIFAWLIFRPLRIWLSVIRRCTFSSNSFPRAAIFFCRSFGKEAITSSTVSSHPLRGPLPALRSEKIGIPAISIMSTHSMSVISRALQNGDRWLVAGRYGFFFHAFLPPQFWFGTGT